MKHLVPLLFVGVRRDITTTLQVQVPEYEIGILERVHGDGNVYPGDMTGTCTAIDADTEYDRLAQKYGEDTVRDAYGANAKRAIRSAVLDSSTGTKEDDRSGIQLEGPDSKPAKAQSAAPEVAHRTEAPSQQWNKTQLTEHAKGLGMEVDPDWTKAQILDAIAAVPA